jgi:hypothetical protein
VSLSTDSGDVDAVETVAVKGDGKASGAANDLRVEDETCSIVDEQQVRDASNGDSPVCQILKL